MKPSTSKNDTPKLVVLGIGLVVIVGMLIMQVQNFNAPQEQVSLPPPDVIPSPQAAVSEPAGFESIVPPADPGVANPDPFRPVLTKGNGVDVSEPVVKVPPMTELAGPKPGLVGPERVPDTQTERIARPKLTGVLLGDRPLAVFDIRGQSQMASIGERLPGGFLVIAISERSVQLAYGKETLTLKLGE